MTVPSCWNMERGELRYFEGSGVYTRESVSPAPAGGTRISPFRGCPVPHDRVSQRHLPRDAQRGLDAILRGNHVGGPRRQPDHRRRGCAKAARPRAEENTDWYHYGGIYRDVLLLRTPSVFIRDWFLRLAPDDGYRTIAFDLRVPGAASIGARLLIPDLGVDVPVPVRDGAAGIRVSARPELWSPESPRLYGFEIECGGDRVRDRVGFRSIRVEGENILLNGRPYYLRGICVHEDHVTKGKTTDEATIRSTIAHVKELNANYIRLAHYPHDVRFARIADEEGVLLWAEVPVYWAIDFSNPAVLADAENQVSELVLRDRNRASVAIWSVGNENADTDERLSFMSRLVEVARGLDGSRPVLCGLPHRSREAGYP